MLVHEFDISVGGIVLSREDETRSGYWNANQNPKRDMCRSFFR